MIFNEFIKNFLHSFFFYGKNLIIIEHDIFLHLTSGSKPPAVLFNNSLNLKLKNIVIYPSDFATIASEGVVLNWANLDFKPIGVLNRRVWHLQGSGHTEQNSATITYTTATPFQIAFEG